MKKYLLLGLIILNVVLASWWIIDGNLFFHTDIARDFLLIEDIIDNKHLTLIGPRSGAIPGLFHGPAWLYLNLPAFLIGAGDPVFIGWFWVILYVLSLLIIYYVGKKLFNKDVGFLSTLLLSSVTILNVRSLFNPYGALLLSPLFFYFFIEYLRNKKIKFLIFSFLTLGFIIQFQMAFGVPILILTIPLLTYYLIRNHKLTHLISVLILLIPLSSFLIFDLRNNFLQIKSVIDYIYGSQSHGKLGLNLLQLIPLRMKELATDGIGVITQNNIYTTILVLAVFILAAYFNIRKKDRNSDLFFLFVYFYLGFWLFTIFFKGPVWNYYYLPFIPLLILFFVSLKSRINKFIFYPIMILIYIINLQVVYKDLNSYNSNPLQQDVSTWQFNKLVAEKVFLGKENQFGYFIFTPDLYGYPPRYALNFYQKRNKERQVYPYKKEPVTYLVIAPPPVYGKDPNSVWYQKNTNSKIWKSNDVRISKEPETKILFDNGFIVERYQLSDEEIKVEPNPYLIKDIFFR